MFRTTKFLFISVVFLQGAAHADDVESAKWSGEGAFSAGVTSGNTETTDVSLGVKAKREMGKWTVGGDVLGEFGQSEGVETRNRQAASAIADRKLNQKLSVFAKGNIVQDGFSGFENRAFLGAGLGYVAMDTEKTKFNLRAALGYQYDTTRATTTEPSDSTGSLGVNAGYDYSYDVNDKVKYSSTGEMFYSEVSTQFVGVGALTAELGGGLSARFSLETRYDTNPPTGFESTDTTTRVSIVYGF